LNNYLIYLSFGNDDYHRETLYSVLSFYKFHSDKDKINVLLYTDTPDFFKAILPAEIQYHIIDSQQITDWKGPLNYIYRIKTKVLQEVCATYSGNFLFVDTDTFFLKNIIPLYHEIQNGKLLLDTCEGKLIDNPGGIARKTRAFLKQQATFSIASDPETISINEQFVAWNSGTIGYTNALSKTLNQIEELIDVLYTKSKLFVVEQIALSYYFQKLTTPIATENYIHHYWDFKEFRSVLKAFFNHNKSKSFAELSNEIDKINPQRLAIPKRQYKKLSFFQKQWRKITTGKKWQIPDYDLE
jgi:hypothetical protein